MKTCTLNDFLAAMRPWLDKEYIRSAGINSDGNFVLYFLDGTKNIYSLTDCNKEQIGSIVKDLKSRGIQILETGHQQ